MSQINLSNKNLTTLRDIAVPSATTVVVLNNNNFSQIPHELKTVTNLSQLQMISNSLEKLDKDILAVPNLTYLHLQGNMIASISDDIQKLNKLQTLVLNQNFLKTIPSSLSKLSSLIGLHLMENKISYLPEDIGELKNLQHLDLRNNQLERLPESIKELTKLQQIYLSGNPKLPLPPNYKEGQNTPAVTIKYILEHQPPFIPPIEIKTNDIYIFRNISNQQEFQEEYQININKALEEYHLNINEVNSIEDLTNETTIVFIIAPFDTHENQKLIFDIISKCQEKEFKYSILIPEKKSVHAGLVNMTHASSIDKGHKKAHKNYADNVFYFKSIPDLTNIIINALKHLSPKIILQKLVLQNIGHFENTCISFDKDITCLVGENGAGKTTLLRALGLSIIGSKNKDIDLLKVENMLRVKSWHTGKMNFADEGSIELHYSIDNKPKTQRISFKHDGVIEIKNESNFETLQNHLDLKTLVIGFPQIRNTKSAPSRQVRTSPNVADIIPLINNIDDERLESFSNWLVNLFGIGQNKINEGNGLVNEIDVEELILIKKVFEVISKLTKHPIKFKTVGKFAPPQIIVTTFDSPEGIPLDLLSQGFKVLIGWIGHFLQRLAEANPMSKYSFEQENAIVIVDEIDSYIHPIWQQGFLQTLRDIFPKTQFIVSTHSPLLVAGLDRNQIIELEYDEVTNTVIPRKDQVDTWAMSYADILLKLFNTKEPEPTKILGELILRLQNLGESDSEEKLILQDNIHRLEQSAAYLNDIEDYKKVLREREEELESVLKELNDKLESLK